MIGSILASRPMKIRDTERPRGTGLLSTLLTSVLLGVGVPFAALTVCTHYGLDFSRDLYIALVSAVGVNGALLLLPPLFRLGEPRPADLAVSYPPASSLVLCDSRAHPELAKDTIDTLLRLPYPGPFQIIVLHAYSDPDFNATLERIAQKHRNFHSLRVSGDPLSSDNLSLGLKAASGDVVAFFRAGQRPVPGAFARAWDWISSGADALGGRCLPSSSDSSWLSRLEAVDLAGWSSAVVPSVLLLCSVDSLRSGNTYWKMTVARQLAGEGPEAGLWRGRRRYRGAYGRDVLVWDPIPTGMRAIWRTRVRTMMSWETLPLTSAL